ncbi:MAG: chemotaxis protein CheW [Xanthomonadales bacterium]|nr:chemotaxis protein CheW [Xanthomonadales bacterium]
MARDSNKAFDVLRDFEKRALIHAVGLPEQSSAQGTWSGIAFRLEGANLVSEIGDIVEIMTVPRYTKVPGSKSWLLGISNVRGNLVPIVDLRGYLSGQKTTIGKQTRVLVVPQQGSTLGLLIDEITGQRHFLEEERSEDSFFAEHMIAPYVEREYAKGDDHWGVLAVRKLVNDPDFLQAAA